MPSIVHINIDNKIVDLELDQRQKHKKKVCNRKIYQIDDNKYGVNMHTIRRKWQAHQGRNRFFCNGRFVMAKQSSVFLLTLFLILLTMILFCVFDLPYLTRTVSIAIPLVSGALFLLVISSLLRTALSDPGIIPRASPREVLEWERQCQESDPFFHRDEWAQARARVQKIRGQNIKTKYCYTCCILRPPRSSHCSICDNCVLNFDHHCPWLGNCIGIRNYRHFYVFITTLSILDAFMAICIGVHVYLLSLEKGTFLEALKESPPSMLTGFINIISIWSVLGLSGFHTYLLALAQTTNEDIKGTFNRKLHPHVSNPYSTGNCFKNILNSLCLSEQPSLLDQRGILPPEEGANIHIDLDLIDKLTMNKQICEQKNMQNVNDITNIKYFDQLVRGNECNEVQKTKNGDIKDRISCPASPHHQRRNNCARLSPLQTTETVLETDHQRHLTFPIGKSNWTLQQSKTRICHANNLIAPIENIQNIQRNPSPEKYQDKKDTSFEVNCSNIDEA